MGNTWTLLKIMVKMQLSMAGKSNSEKAGYGFLFVFMIPFGILILYTLNTMIGALYTNLSPTGNENVILGLLFVFITFIFIFVSLSTVLSSFYFAEDVESFIALPFHPYQIVIGKSAIPFLSLYGINTILLLPSLMFYGIHSGSGLLYYLFAIIIWLITPVLPFVATAIVVMFIMRFANISKNKDRTKVIVGLLGFAFAIGINVLLRLDSGSSNGDGMTELITEQNALLGLITKFFPNAYLSSIALTDPSSIVGLSFLLLLLGIAVLSIILFMTVGQQWYFKGVLGLSGGKRSRFKDTDLTKQTKRKTILYSLWQKEIKTIFRTPTFFTQIVVQSLFFPLFIVIILLLEGNGSLSDMATMINGWGNKTMLLTLFAFTIVGLGINPASFSSISRDGKSWFNHLYLPVTPNTVIMSKVLVSFFLNGLSLLILSVVVIFFLNVPLGIWSLWFMASLCVSWVTSVIGLLLDLYQPKLNWTDEREVFKGRMIGLFAIGIEVMVFGILLLILWLAPMFSNIASTSLFLFSYLVLCVVIGQWYLKKMTKDKFTSII